MKKIIISNYDISKYFDVNKNKWIGSKGNNIHLIYIENRGYIFIHQKGDITYKYAIKTDDTVNKLVEDVQKNSGEKFFKTENIIIQEIIKIFDEKIFPEPKPLKILSKYDNKSDYEKIINNLIVSLQRKEKNNEYAKVKEYKNQNIKDLIQDPDTIFNNLIHHKPLTENEYKTLKKEFNNELTNQVFNLLLLYSEHKNIMGYADKEEIKTKPIITEPQFIKMLMESVSDAISNPLFNLRYGIGKERINYINGVDEVIDEFNIKGIFRNNTETIYYYNDELSYYQELSENDFKNMIVNYYGLKLLPKDYKTIYNAIPTTDTEDNSILVFNNTLYDIDMMEEIDIEFSEYTRKDYISSHLIGFEDDNDNIKLLNFDEFIDLKNIVNPDGNNKQTYVEKTLREILIPKEEPENNKLLIDFLQRFGSCILGRNKYKTITLYYGDGNNGKGVLKLLFELIYNHKAYSLTPDILTEKFNLKSFMGRKCILLDEIDKTGLNTIKPTIKRMSSPESRHEQRGMYTDKNIVLKNYPNFFIFSNDTIDIKLDELALFQRFDFLKLPNIFTTEEKAEKLTNAYVVDRETETKIKEDYDGLSWLISASIKLFKSMEDNRQEYRARQTIEETMDILLNVDYLTKFIKIYTERDENIPITDYITNDEILGKYEEYMENENKLIHETQTELRKKIGSTIKSVYHIKGKLSDSDIYKKQDNTYASYQLRIKSIEELQKDKNTQYKINEDNYKQLSYISNEAKNVYNKIKQGKNTIKLIQKDYPKYNVIDIVYELVDLGLILKSDQTSL